MKEMKMEITLIKTTSGKFNRLTWFITDMCFPSCYKMLSRSYCNKCLLGKCFTHKVDDGMQSGVVLKIKPNMIILLGDEEEKYD